MNILYLYSELGPYLIPNFRILSEQYGYNLHVIHWDQKQNLRKPYLHPELKRVTFHKRSDITNSQIKELAIKLRPSLIYVSGWMDKGYLSTAKLFKSHGVPVVAGFDDQWEGSIKQILGQIFLKILVHHFFTFAWISGPRQYEYAKKIGFKDRYIIYDLLSCDRELFKYQSSQQKYTDFPKKFIYVGNFSRIKGTDILLKAFKRYKQQHRGDWSLVCIGNGELEYLLKNEPGVEVYSYMEQSKIVDMSDNFDVFILPSRHEQWGVVVHEFASLGFPLILSDKVGAKDVFFIEEYNGFSFSNNSIDQLALKMHEMSSMQPLNLRKMGRNSLKLASRIDNNTSIANLLSVIRKKQTKIC